MASVLKMLVMLGLIAAPACAFQGSARNRFFSLEKIPSQSSAKLRLHPNDLTTVEMAAPLISLYLSAITFPNGPAVLQIPALMGRDFCVLYWRMLGPLIYPHKSDAVQEFGGEAVRQEDNFDAVDACIIVLSLITTYEVLRVGHHFSHDLMETLHHARHASI
jgi:hypothetical protein